MPVDYLEYAYGNLVKATERPEYKRYLETDSPYGNEAYILHVTNVAEYVAKLWRMKFGSELPAAMKIASWYHDFDRLLPERRLDTSTAPIERYTDVKKMHSKNCAVLFAEFNPELPEGLTRDVQHLIERAEERVEEGNAVDNFTGSYNLDKASNILCEADGLSFFDVIIYPYARMFTPERVNNKILFSYAKLSEDGKRLLDEMEFSDAVIESLVRNLIS